MSAAAEKWLTPLCLLVAWGKGRHLTARARVATHPHHQARCHDTATGGWAERGFPNPICGAREWHCARVSHPHLMWLYLVRPGGGPRVLAPAQDGGPVQQEHHHHAAEPHHQGAGRAAVVGALCLDGRVRVPPGAGDGRAARGRAVVSVLQAVRPLGQQCGTEPSPLSPCAAPCCPAPRRLLLANAQPQMLTSFAVSLLLVFRTNQSYDRWWEARKIWGGILNRVRDITTQVRPGGPRSERQVLGAGRGPRATHPGVRFGSFCCALDGPRSAWCSSPRRSSSSGRRAGAGPSRSPGRSTPTCRSVRWGLGSQHLAG